MSEHTPGPWKNNCFMVLAPPNVGTYGGRQICHTGTHSDIRDGAECEANAEFIVRACNNHDDLLSCVEATLAILNAWGPERWGDTLERLHAKLTKTHASATTK